MKKPGNINGGNNGRDGDKNLSALYDKLSTELPASKLDETILSAAHEKARAGKRKKVSTSPFSSNWAVPLSLAATVVLSVSIVLTIPDADLKSPQDLQMRRLKTQVPESIEAEKNSQMNKDNLLKLDESTAGRKQTSTRSPGIKEEKRDALLLQKGLVKLKPAMAPAERSAPASIAPLKLQEEADLAAPRDNTRARSVAPKKALQKEKIKMKSNDKPTDSKKTFANIGKVKPGLSKQAVFELLGEPYKKTNASWLYRIIENNQAQNYTITFENNLVITVEMVTPALRNP